MLPAIDEPFDILVTATAGYAHLCCEQTAAKILSAMCMYLTASKSGQRRKAEQIILAGIAREKKMLRPGRGFAMYPKSNNISKYYSPKAVRYLWKLHQLDELPDISSGLRQAVRNGSIFDRNNLRSCCDAAHYQLTKGRGIEMRTLRKLVPVLLCVVVLQFLGQPPLHAQSQTSGNEADREETDLPSKRNFCSAFSPPPAISTSRPSRSTKIGKYRKG